MWVPAKKPMSASTKRNSQKCICHWRPSEHSLMDTRESTSSVLSSEQKFRTSSRQAGQEITYLRVFCSFNKTEFQTSSEKKGASKWRWRGITLDDRSPLNALNEDDWAPSLHLMIGHLHVDQRPILLYLYKPINTQQCHVYLNPLNSLCPNVTLSSDIIIKNYLWISWGIYINTPKIHTKPTAPFFSLKMETLRFVYISVKFV